MKSTICLSALVGLGLCLPVLAGEATDFQPGLVDMKTMDGILATATKEVQLAYRGGHGGWNGGRGGYGGRHGGWGGHGYRGHYRGDSWVGPAVGGALLGAIIANQAYSAPVYREDVVYREVPVYRDEPVYRSGRSSDPAKRRCASKYRSYDWRSETYVAQDGRVKSCP